MTTDHDPHELLQYRAALRRLAQGLLNDEARADDAVQEAYLAAALRGPDTLVDPRGWLARVVQNRARRMLRSDGNRRDRERARAREQREGSVPASDRVLTRIETQRQVLDALRELREPYRVCVWMRYFDELPPTAIAKRLDIPAQTVKSRLERGRAELRRKLEARLGSGGHDWRLALLAAPWRGPGPRGSEAANPPLAPGKLAAAASVAGLLAVAAWSGAAAATHETHAGGPVPPAHAALANARPPAGTEAETRAPLAVARRKPAAVLPAPLATQEPAAAASLVPAGTLNGVLSGPEPVIVVEDDLRLIRQAQRLSERFFSDAEILTGGEALDRDLAAHTLIVYATPADPWLAELAERLPFGFTSAGLELAATAAPFEGERLRLICALANPANPERRMALYTAREVDDLIEVNAVFHGPTEWVVANGREVLDAGRWPPGPALAREAALRDLERLEADLLAVHPATVEGPPPALTAALDEARRALARGSEPIAREELWFVLNGVLLALADSHTCMTSMAPGESLDLPLRWLADGLVVDADTAELAFGDRVVSIGGATSDQLLAGLRRIVPAETDQWVRTQAPRHLRDLSVLERLGVADGAPVEVVVERDGQSLASSIGLGRTPSRSPVGPRPDVAWRLFEDRDLAVLTLDTCRPDDAYRRTLYELFEAVARKGIGRLAIDLRENSGGNSRVVDDFLRHLDVDAYRNYGGVMRVSEPLIAKTGAEDLELGIHTGPVTLRENPRYVDPPPFTGELFVLVSPRTYSSGNWFAVVLADNGLATVVGEPTGNAPSSFGDILHFDLPASRFTYTLSHKRYVRPDPSADPAPHLAPDFSIPFLREHLLAGSDPVLEWLLEP